VKDFQHYEGPLLLHEMCVGSSLELKQEPKNKYDSAAIQVLYNKKKIGYIPIEENQVLSKLLDANLLEFSAEITHLETEASTWENVHIAVSVLKEKVNPDAKSEYLKTMTSPDYHTIVTADYYSYNTTKQHDRIKEKANETLSDVEFYDTMME
jgi:hypothetical protein